MHPCIRLTVNLTIFLIFCFVNILLIPVLILQIHHVKQGDPNELFYDLAFLASGLILFLIGMMIKRNTDGISEIRIRTTKEKVKQN